ncbi:MAG: arsenic resistance N-acetyltransferase ArsN2, partial [Chitinophagales bacterium]
MKIKIADMENLPAIQNLLKEAALPFADIETHLSGFIIGTENENILAVAGLEIEDDIALLRSVAVKQEYRNKGLGEEIVRVITNMAISKNINSIYLLTETAEKFFSRMGFAAISRNDVHPQIKNTEEYKT